MDWALFTINIVNKNDAPTCSDDTRSIVEGAAVGTAVGAAGLGSASDPDGDALNWVLLFGDVDRAFNLNPTTGALTMQRNVTNYEVRRGASYRWSRLCWWSR